MTCQNVTRSGTSVNPVTDGCVRSAIYADPLTMQQPLSPPTPASASVPVSASAPVTTGSPSLHADGRAGGGGVTSPRVLPAYTSTGVQVVGG